MIDILKKYMPEKKAIKCLEEIEAYQNTPEETIPQDIMNELPELDDTEQEPRA